MEEETIGQIQSAEPTAPTAGPSSEQSETAAPAAGETNPEQGEKLIPIPSEKWREANIARRELRDLKTAIAEKENLRNDLYQRTAPYVPNIPESSQDPSAAAAIQSIAQAVKTELSPYLSAFETQQQQRVIADVESRPYAKELSTEIANFVVDPNLAHLPFEQRLDYAYNAAIGQNFSKLQGQSFQGGYDAAYNKVAEKQAAQVSSSPAGTLHSTKEYTAEDLDKMSVADFRKNRADIFEQLTGVRPKR